MADDRNSHHAADKPGGASMNIQLALEARLVDLKKQLLGASTTSQAQKHHSWIHVK